MNRRKDGRELFEVFRETMATSAPSGTLQHRGPAGPSFTSAAEPVGRAQEEPVHTIRLGDRRQVEVYLSMSWVYWLMIFAFFLLALAFMAGRKFAPVPKPVQAETAPESFIANEASPVAKAITRVTSPAASTGAAATVPAAPPADTGAAVVERVVPRQEPPQVSALAPVTGQGNYTLRLITYSDTPAWRKRAEEVAKFLRDQGFKDVRVLAEKNGKRIIVALGNYATRSGPEINDDKVRLSALSYQGADFKAAYAVNLADYK